MPVDGPDIEAAVPPRVRALFDRLRANGHAAYVVGGSLRDLWLDRAPLDWDLATDALPERVQELFADARYENAFGTVIVELDDGSAEGSADGPAAVEITTFRSDHEYADFRRPHHVVFGDRVELDLARRDFTCNALAWGGPPDAAPGFVDPFEGRADIERRLLRAVGDPALRFHEDALRMLRAARFSAVLGFTIEPATREAMVATAPLAERLSGERILAELGKLLDADRPSIGLRCLADTGLLAAIAPVLDRQRGVPQNKVAGEDLWDHVLRAVDGAAAARRSRTVRLTTLVHDIGKPATAADGHFYGHEVVGAALAAELLTGWHAPRDTVDEVTRLVRHHMFAYAEGWSDSAVRRFIAKVGSGVLDDLFALREADNIGSGIAPDGAGLASLRRRVEAELAAGAVLDRSGLAVHGDDLIAELGIAPGPTIGLVLDALLERVMNDPRQNRRATLIALARDVASRMSDSAAGPAVEPVSESRETG